MSNINYTITRFDKDTMSITVNFVDGVETTIRLVNPLPANIEALNQIIKTRVAPVESFVDRSENVDLGFITDIIGVEQTTSRMYLTPPLPEVQETQLPPVDEDAKTNAEMWANVGFEQRVAAALVSLGVLETDPTIIPVGQE